MSKKKIEQHLTAVDDTADTPDIDAADADKTDDAAEPEFTERDVNGLDDLRKLQKGLITRATAARVLGIDARTLQQAVRDGVLPTMTIGKNVYIVRERFIDQLS